MEMFEGIIVSPGGILGLFAVMIVLDAIAVGLAMTFTKKL